MAVSLQLALDTIQNQMEHISDLAHQRDGAVERVETLEDELDELLPILRRCEQAEVTLTRRMAAVPGMRQELDHLKGVSKGMARVLLQRGTNAPVVVDVSTERNASATQVQDNAQAPASLERVEATIATTIRGLESELAEADAQISMSTEEVVRELERERYELGTCLTHRRNTSTGTTDHIQPAGVSTGIPIDEDTPPSVLLTAELTKLLAQLQSFGTGVPANLATHFSDTHLKLQVLERFDEGISKLESKINRAQHCTRGLIAVNDRREKVAQLATRVGEVLEALATLRGDDIREAGDDGKNTEVGEITEKADEDAAGGKKACEVDGEMTAETVIFAVHKNDVEGCEHDKAAGQRKGKEAASTTDAHLANLFAVYAGCSTHTDKALVAALIRQHQALNGGGAEVDLERVIGDVDGSIAAPVDNDAEESSAEGGLGVNEAHKVSDQGDVNAGTADVHDKSGDAATGAGETRARDLAQQSKTVKTADNRDTGAEAAVIDPGANSHDSGHVEGHSTVGEAKVFVDSDEGPAAAAGVSSTVVDDMKGGTLVDTQAAWIGYEDVTAGSTEQQAAGSTIIDEEILDAHDHNKAGGKGGGNGGGGGGDSFGALQNASDDGEPAVAGEDVSGNSGEEVEVEEAEEVEA
ncbi:hypothetical protein CALCODRAFT_488017 [Calocera cornea HHB12733]|uniref:Uncharacterized protein n=1 Tax=Calocera cornea HHB12733 TaxID=1353952 RepID=A0A165CSQ6_9BASI|nr:hypothetical protein CALCODRAFT_488017 [Calocera cornea HHB12733]